MSDKQETLLLRPIAHIRTDFPEKFGIPRQSGLLPDAEALIVFEEEYRAPEAFRGLEGFSHLWLLWQFSENVRDGWQPTVRPPRLGGNRRMGVFATRSPFRPNPIGLSSVRLLAVEQSARDGIVLRVAGADLMDGTPIYDVKPYLAFTDSHPDALGGFSDPVRDRALSVDFPPDLLDRVPASKRSTLLSLLANDPRPAYQSDPDRVYFLSFSNLRVSFLVRSDTLSVLDVE